MSTFIVAFEIGKLKYVEKIIDLEQVQKQLKEN